MDQTGKISIGNVSFYKSDVKESSVMYKDGQKLNCVFLNDGTKITFKDQKKDANASVEMGNYMGPTQLENKRGTGFFGIQGLTIEGSNYDDYYHLFNCDDFNVDTKGGGHDEVRVFNNNGKHINGELKTDGNDRTSVEDNPQISNRSEGFFVRPKFSIIKKNGEPLHYKNFENMDPKNINH